MEKDIGKIKKNDTTDIIVRIDDFGGKVGLTIREYTTSEKYTGFTKSGTRIPADSFKDFRTVINSIDENDLKPVSSGSAEESKSEPKHEKKSKKSEEVPEEDLF